MTQGLLTSTPTTMRRARHFDWRAAKRARRVRFALERGRSVRYGAAASSSGVQDHARQGRGQDNFHIECSPVTGVTGSPPRGEEPRQSAPSPMGDPPSLGRCERRPTWSVGRFRPSAQRKGPLVMNMPAKAAVDGATRESLASLGRPAEDRGRGTRAHGCPRPGPAARAVEVARSPAPQPNPNPNVRRLSCSDDGVR